MTSLAALRALAAIRLVNGVLGLFTPGFLVRRLGFNPSTTTAAFYPFRMFGVRTILLGSDLLLLRGDDLERAVKTAVVVHGSDTMSALVGGLRREVPGRTAVVTTLISATNTGLAVVAVRGRVWEQQPPSGGPGCRTN